MLSAPQERSRASRLDGREWVRWTSFNCTAGRYDVEAAVVDQSGCLLRMDGDDQEVD